MIKFNGLNLKDLKITDALASVVNGKKIAVGSEVIWEKSVSPLPSGYTQVKYLQSSGTQYIDSNVTITVNSEILIQMAILALSGNVRIGSIVNIGNVTSIYVGLVSGNSLRAIFGANNNGGVVLTSGVDTDFHEYFISNGLQRIDTTTATNTIEQISSTIGTLALFTEKNTYSGTRRISAKVSKFEMADNGTPQANFIPCLDTNNTPCFYDTVTQQTFYNQGTGEFGYETMDGTVVAPT